jgi:hypothetical protein
VAATLAGCDDILLNRPLQGERFGIGHPAEITDIEMG